MQAGFEKVRSVYLHVITACPYGHSYGNVTLAVLRTDMTISAAKVWMLVEPPHGIENLVVGPDVIPVARVPCWIRAICHGGGVVETIPFAG